MSCAGIVANTNLAADAGIETRRGIKVNNYLQTSDPYIYAVGECAEHMGKTYGLIGPGIEQASVAVKNILYNNVEEYTGSAQSMRVKVKHMPVFSLETNKLNKQGLKRLIFEDDQAVKFRELLLKKGRLVGATALGEWPEIAQVQEAIDNRMYIWPWHRFYFSRKGSLWPESDFTDPNVWPDSTMVCTCGAVTRGQVGTAIKEGCDTVLKVRERTGAALGCGTCKPILAMLTGSKSEPLSATLTGSFFFCTLLVAVFSASFLLPPFSIPASLQQQSFLSELLFDNGWQQVSGYTVLALMAFSFVLSINKRWKMLQFASFYFWRVMHVLFLSLSIAILLIHTNFSLGQNFNFQFIIFYFITMASGFVIGSLVILEGGFFGAMFRNTRTYLARLHIVLVWILTGLLVSHIASVYYF